MSLYGFQVLDKVLEQGSYAKAAKLLHMTSSAISHIIVKLEDEVGFQLLNRDRNGVSLTGAGQVLMPYIKDLLHTNENLNQAISEMHGLEKGIVRIGSFNSAIVQWLPDVIRYFHAEYPGIEIQVQDGSYEDIVMWMNSNLIDIAFLSGTAEPERNLKDAEVIPLYEDRFMCVTPMDFTPEHGDYVTVDDIRDTPLIMQDGFFNQEAKYFLDKHGLSSKSSFAISGDDGIIAMVKAGFGIYIMTELVVRGIQGDYRTFPIEPAEYRHIVLCVNTQQVPTTAVSLMRDQIVRYVGGLE